MAGLTNPLDRGYGCGSDNGGGNPDGSSFGFAQFANFEDGDGFEDGCGYGCGDYKSAVGFGNGDANGGGYGGFDGSDGCGEGHKSGLDDDDQDEGFGSGRGESNGFGDADGCAEDELTGEVTDRETKPILLLAKRLRRAAFRRRWFENQAAPECMIAPYRRWIDKLRAALRAHGTSEKSMATWESFKFSSSDLSAQVRELPAIHKRAAEHYAKYIFGLEYDQLGELMFDLTHRYFGECDRSSTSSDPMPRDSVLPAEHKRAAEDYALYIFGIHHEHLRKLMVYLYTKHGDDCGLGGDVNTAPPMDERSELLLATFGSPEDDPSNASSDDDVLTPLHKEAAEHYARYIFGMHHLRAKRLMAHLFARYDADEDINDELDSPPVDEI